MYNRKRRIVPLTHPSFEIRHPNPKKAPSTLFAFSVLLETLDLYHTIHWNAPKLFQ